MNIEFLEKSLRNLTPPQVFIVLQFFYTVALKCHCVFCEFLTNFIRDEGSPGFEECSPVRQ